jgi:hypothetical protein
MAISPRHWGQARLSDPGVTGAWQKRQKLGKMKSKRALKDDFNMVIGNSRSLAYLG